MRLITTLWSTVNWKKVLFWYMIGMLIVSFNEKNDISVIIISIFVMTFIVMIVMLMTWNQVIHGYSEGFPVVWIWSYVVSDVKIFKKDQGFIERKKWCKLNTEGKWIHCEHGYFAFRKKTDAMAFKLRWL